MMNVACPYCGKMAEEGNCESCQKPFFVGMSDGNRHSFSEIDVWFPAHEIMGAFSVIGYRTDQFHCSACGLVTDRCHETCPSLIALALFALLDGEFLRLHTGGVDQAMAGMRLEKFLASHRKLLVDLWCERDFRKRFQLDERKAVELLMGLTR